LVGKISSNLGIGFVSVVSGSWVGGTESARSKKVVHI
jgi:hypothetical protein